MLHPATVHFAIVLPVVASVFGAIYLVTKSESMSKISTRATLLAAIAMIGVWYTGNQAGPKIFQFLSEAGKHELLEHKELGLYLAIAMAIIALLKIVGCKAKMFKLEAIAILLLFATMFTTFIQGKHGGEIVYNYGMPFKAYKIQSTLKNVQAQADDAEDDSAIVEMYEDALDTINEVSQEVDTIYGNTTEDKE